ncbi:MAG: hypothetical protein MUE46_20870 [Xanthomonadales bacterium]|nr:hypothetical protein [Xanthomonadales bacterium]
MTRSRWILLALVALAIGAFFALDLDRYLTLAALKSGREALSGWVSANLALAVAAYFVAYVAVTASRSPRCRCPARRS